MKNVGIHVLDFNDNIIDFISQSDGALINAEMSMNVEEKTETFDFTIENTRAEKLRERNRIIAQDNNGTFREFIIIHIADNFDGTTEIECNASYLEDLKTAKPIKPGKFEAHTTTQALLKTLADTGWEVSDDTEYGGNRTTSWTSHTNPFDLIYMLCTTYDMVPNFYIELGAHTVEHRYVSITKSKNLFKGKEITKGKDLTGMTRTIDLSEVKTALLAVGPEKEDGSRIETVVVDDEAQEIFGLPNRYIWDVYEPETEDENMTLKRLTTLAKTELNKRNQAAISYEVSSTDIHKYYNDVTVHLRDIVRVKDRDFRPPLYIEAEVIGIKYNWLADESEFTFGNVIEYEETKLREFFTRKLDEITKKLNDNISNVNTIVSDVVAGELEYYERKIFKGAEPPENPQNDTLWYDTSNPDVAVLRRYWNGKWITQTADDVEKIGGLRREQVMYRDLNNSFINLTIQHSNLQNDVYDVLNSEYLADDDLKANLNQALSDVDSVYQNIKTNLDSMDEDTATIGKLVDTQTLFTVYREKLQTLYKYVTDAKISIDKRLKLLQSQYTDEKFNDAMDKIAQTLPNGRWDSENQQLYADIPNEQELSNLKQTLQDYYDGNIKELEGRLNNSVDSKVNIAKNEISTSVKSVESKIDGLNIGTRNLLLNSEERSDSIFNDTHAYITYFLTQPLEVGEEYTITSEVYATSSEQSGKISIRGFFPDNGLINVPIIDDKIKLTFKAKVPSERILLYKDIAGQSSYKLDTTFKNTILVKGNKIGDYAPAPEDLKQDFLNTAGENTENALKPITTRVTTNETNISELDKQISLMAKSDDVAQKLKKVDNRLTPLETDVKRNKATLNILPTQIEGKVSKQDYTLDKNNIVKRLNNADSERKQLSNEITDKVTITKFESGIAEAKKYTDNTKEEATTYTDNKINSLSVGSRNLLENSANIKKEFNDEMAGLTQFYRVNLSDIHNKLRLGDVVTISFDIEMEQGNILRVYDTNINYDFILGTETFNDIGKGKKRLHFTKTLTQTNKDSGRWILDFYNYGNTDDKYTISNIKIEKGTIATDWTPAPEDIERAISNSNEEAEKAAKAYADAQDNLKETQLKAYADGVVSKEEERAIADAESKLQEAKTHAEETSSAAQTAAEKYAVIKANDAETNAKNDATTKANKAEANAKAYTDAYKQNNDVAMTQLETSVSQLDGKVSIKVDEQKFNASRKTLSQVIAEISATTKGINLSYDENGNIQSYTMDRNGIQLRGDKVDITVNKDFNVMASKVDDKVGKNEIINRLNLSPEGLDIDVNKIGIRGGNNKTYLKLSQDKIELAGEFNRTWRGDTQKDSVYMRAQGGLLRFRNNTKDRSLYYSDFGISTYVDGNNEEASGSLQFFDYTYSTARGVTLNSSNGVAAVTSDNNRVILDAKYTVNIESSESSVYIRPFKNSRVGVNEFRFWTKLADKENETDGVLSYGAVTELPDGTLPSYSMGASLRFEKNPRGGNRVYATNVNGDIGTGDFYGNRLFGDWTTKSTNLYAQVLSELRVTDLYGYNGGNPNYKNLRVNAINTTSSYAFSNHSGADTYFGVGGGELIITNNNHYNGGDTKYRNIRFGKWYAMSSEKYKYDIKEWDYSVLDAFRNDLQLYSYKYKSEKDSKYIRNHHGVIIERELPIEWRHGDGFDGNEVMFWNTKAIQELTAIVDKQSKQIQKLEEQLNEQSITS